MFRQEVLDHRRNRLMGEVVIAIPPSWQMIGLLFFVLVFAVSTFLATATYSRTESVPGVVMPDRGVAVVVPTRPGVVAGLKVAEGAVVKRGDELLTVRSEEDSAAGPSSVAQVATAVREQDAGLAAQMEATRAALGAQLEQIGAQMRGLEAEVQQLEAQIVLQGNLVRSAQGNFESAKRVAERGFISQNDLRVREDTLVSRRQALSQLIQSRDSKRAQWSELSRSSAQARSQNLGQLASLAAARSEVAQQAANVAGTRSYVLRAPVAGRVTAVIAKLGQPVDSRTSVLSVVPVGSRMQAELMVPPSAIGFIKPGQSVRLAIDAFPYQQLGTIPGTISSVARSPISFTSAAGVSSAYPVIVSIQRESISAFGREEPLLPGMTLSARIVLQKQSLLEWLFEPLFAVRRR
jgi:membrane fusion protein